MHTRIGAAVIAALGLFAMNVSAQTVKPAAAPSVEDVGDADSFGRSVTYLGLAQTIGVALQADCSVDPVPPTEGRCVTLAPAPAITSFNEADLATVRLPARATKSLICFAFTPFSIYQLSNTTGTLQHDAGFSGSARIIIENSVLDDPTLIDPSTGLPFGGRIETVLSTNTDRQSLQPGERAFRRVSLTRHCIGGIITKRSLIEAFGLSEAQAREFFRQPMTLRFGAFGSGKMLEFGNYFYGIRLFGD